MGKALIPKGFYVGYRRPNSQPIVKWKFIETNNIIEAINQANEYAKEENLVVAHLIDEVTWRGR